MTWPRQMVSVLYNAPHWIQTGAQAAVAGAFVLFAFFAWRIEMPPIRRCMFAAALILSFQLASPLLHQNYFIWWYMPICVSVTALAFNPACYEWISSRHKAR
jgi:hypothetical protein